MKFEKKAKKQYDEILFPVSVDGLINNVTENRINEPRSASA